MVNSIGCNTACGGFAGELWNESNALLTITNSSLNINSSTTGYTSPVIGLIQILPFTLTILNVNVTGSINSTNSSIGAIYGYSAGSFT